MADREQELAAVRQERDELLKIVRDLHACRRTCPTILRFAISAKEILKDASKWDKR